MSEIENTQSVRAELGAVFPALAQVSRDDCHRDVALSPDEPRSTPPLQADLGRLRALVSSIPKEWIASATEVDPRSAVEADRWR